LELIIARGYKLLQHAMKQACFRSFSRSLPMKAAFALVFAALSFAAVSASDARANACADCIRTVLKCQPLRPIMDAGTYVEIRSGGIAGITQAHVTEQTIAGPRTVGTYRVSSVRSGPSMRYVGLDFDLVIHTEEAQLPRRGYRSELSLDRNRDGRLVRELSCEFVANPL
jgi:hypothetical protein